jgi:hypothetical protein
MVEKIDDLLHKRTKSLAVDKNKKFHEIVKKQKAEEKELLRRTVEEFKENVFNWGRDIKFIFEKLDLDGNGVLSPDEIKSAFLILGVGK